MSWDALAIIIVAVSSRMVVYIAIVRRNGDIGYIASVPDFPGLD